MKFATIITATFACCNEPHVIALGMGTPNKKELEDLIAREELSAGPCSNVTLATMLHENCFEMCLNYVMNSDEVLTVDAEVLTAAANGQRDPDAPVH